MEICSCFYGFYKVQKYLKSGYGFRAGKNKFFPPCKTYPLPATCCASTGQPRPCCAKRRITTSLKACPACCSGRKSALWNCRKRHWPSSGRCRLGEYRWKPFWDAPVFRMTIFGISIDVKLPARRAGDGMSPGNVSARQCAETFRMNFVTASSTSGATVSSISPYCFPRQCSGNRNARCRREGSPVRGRCFPRGASAAEKGNSVYSSIPAGSPPAYA